MKVFFIDAVLYVGTMERPRDIFQAIWRIIDPSLIPPLTPLHAKVCSRWCALSFGSYENDRALQSCPEMCATLIPGVVLWMDRLFFRVELLFPYIHLPTL